MAEEEVKLLNIKSLQRNDTGAYLCRVLNEYGLADLVHHLVVLPGKEMRFKTLFIELFPKCSSSIRTTESIDQTINWSRSFPIQSITR